MSKPMLSAKDFIADTDALDRLIEEHRLLKETIEHSPLPFCVYDQDDRLIAHNVAYEAIHAGVFGDAGSAERAEPWTYPEVVRKHLAGKMPAAEIEAEVASRVRAQRNADGKAVERHYGDHGWLRVTKFKTPSGAVAGMALDINELKAREEELEVAWKAAKVAERAKSEFLANMSHEIRTPMNGVIGMAELMSKMQLDDRQRMFNDVIIKSGHALLKVINDVLDFSKIEAHQMQLDVEPFDLAETVETASTLFSAEIASRDVELVVRVQPDLPSHVVGDAGRLRQVLTNLIGNATKFTEDGHIFVNVEMCGEAADGAATVLFQVEDTGPGIPKAQCERIFAKFTQVDGSSKRKHEGTGLGLSIASSLIELMDGEIGVDSREGLGATFWARVTFPIAEDAEMRPSLAASEIEGARVLIIDDNRVNRMILSELTASWNLRSTASSSGEAGLSALKDASGGADPYDLVLLDHHMPGLSGEEVLRAIRHDLDMPDLPVIFLTSVDYVPTSTSSASDTLAGRLTKPVKSSDLLDMSRAALSGRLQAPPAAALPATPVIAASPPPPPDIAAQDGQLDVLIAEDVAVGQLLMRQIMETARLSAKIVGNGKLVVAAHRLHRPKVILMDLAMPEMNGVEATRLIREAEEDKDHRTPIIGVTAHALRGDREECLAAGMDDYVTKPISPDHLIATIERWMYQGAV